MRTVDRALLWVIEQVLDHPGVADAVAADDRPVPRCAIRRTCRWFAQEGAAACHACPFVITDARGADDTAPIS